ncbi:MAG: endonuclease/exonuclease/phosphatase family protein, partial [Bacteroidota bacterium]
MDEINLLVENRDPDIFCVSETWINVNIQDRFINIPGYNVFRCDGGRGAGSCIYVKSSISSRVIDTNIDKCSKIEDLWIQIQVRKLPSLIIGTAYRHPNALAESYDYLESILREMNTRNKPIIMVGDLNDDLLIQNSKLQKVIKSLNLKQLISKPTRITLTCKTLLDVIITNQPKIVISSEVNPCPVADHELISVTLNIGKPKRLPQYKTFRSLENYSLNTFGNLILDKQHLLNSILNTDNVDEQVNTMTTVLTSCIDEVSPKVTKLIRRPPAPWINDDIRKAIKDRDYVHRQLKLNGENMELHVKYKDMKKDVKTIMHREKTKFFKS